MLKLPRLPAQQLLVTLTGEPSLAFTVYWQQILEAIEAQEGLQDQIIADLQQVTTDLQQAVSDIQAAMAAAGAAQTTATEAAREAARVNSYPSPGNILSGTDAGTDATITIANHTRVYPIQGSSDVPDVAIIGGTLTGKAYSTRYYIYYDDTTLSVTNPTFVATTNSATAQVGAAAGRHFVGYITTPAAGGSSSGSGSGPPGGGGGGSGGEIIV